MSDTGGSNPIKAVQNGDLETLKYYLSENPQWVEKPDENGLYPIFIAARKGDYNMVKYLVEYSRCSMNISDPDNQTTLHYASMYDNVDLVDYLITRVGEDPYRANSKGEIPYDLAVKHKAIGVIDYYEDQYQFQEGYYRNPIMRGFNPDPSIIGVGKDYYMVTSTFVFFPAIPIYHSRDLIHWQVIGHAVTDPNDLDLSDFEDGRGIWAPDISYNQGKFFITATLRMNDTEDVLRKQMVVYSEKPQGPYSHPTYIEEDGIDPSIFTDDDGKRYMLLNRGARLFEINELGSEKLSESELIWYGSNKRAPEAPHLFKRNGYYYCLLAEGGTGMNHQVSIARALDLKGPYEACPYNPIMIQRNSLDPIQRSGHAKMMEDAHGDWWMVYLCGRRYEGQYTILGRETCLDPVTWSEEGWPMVNGNRGPSSIQRKPKGWREVLAFHLPQSIFEHQWLFVRTPEISRIIRDYHNGFIRFYPDSLPLSDKHKRNTMVLRQTHWHFEVDMVFDYRHATETCQFGLTAYYDTHSFLKFGVVIQNAEPHFFLEEQRGNDNAIQWSTFPVESGQIMLKMTTQGLKRSFWYHSEVKGWQKIFEIDKTDYLSDEGISIGKRFTGATFGTFGVGEKTNVDFSYDLVDIHCINRA